MFHPYLIGEPTAIAALDAVKAAHELLVLLEEETPVEPDGRLVSWGASQGGHAALFVQRFAPFYTPGFEVPCVIAAVPPADLLGQSAKALLAFDSAAAMGTAFFTASYLWYQPEIPISAIFNPDGPEDYSDYIVEKFQETCNAKDLFKGASCIEDVYTGVFLTTMQETGLDAFLPWGCYAAENSLPSTSVPLKSDAEVLFILAENDSLVDPDVGKQSFETLCQQGYAMQFIECTGLGHTEAALETVNLQIEWALACLDGGAIPPDELCKVQEPQTCEMY